MLLTKPGTIVNQIKLEEEDCTVPRFQSEIISVFYESEVKIQVLFRLKHVTGADLSRIKPSW